MAAVRSTTTRSTRTWSRWTASRRSSRPSRRTLRCNAATYNAAKYKAATYNAATLQHTMLQRCNIKRCSAAACNAATCDEQHLWSARGSRGQGTQAVWARRYLKNTSGGWRTGQLLEVLECNRHTEGKHSRSHWRSTNAVVARQRCCGTGGLPFNGVVCLSGR